MPDLEHCVREKDKIYCWDDETGQVIEFTERKLAITDCPPYIATALVRCLNRQENKEVKI
jgi:hypothetical protein